ncbi:divergent polysaccharide deacetylase family protein [Geosporobacter ferrireducens]|uniref:Divergent polysaccharide deacetylase family protein n=1 Tax=Geosporobacter ferrireducens TaxID=1424294 RepID=A0A1D8GC60_9FIRM|nr:divergent polysaccharide deacetylase family protein [Geosporobacter ferrireducens]AOT68497.1 hypothetical protein Gferi_02145 [Geosporobacter ferrireducens]MTI53958.1 divergent polysaccharide deacetylase family protein [Geosporobacter ferrireducens]
MRIKKLLTGIGGFLLIVFTYLALNHVTLLNVQLGGIIDSVEKAEILEEIKGYGALQGGARLFRVEEDKKYRAKVAFLIDDFGNNGEGTAEMMTIDRPMTFAIMPFMKYSKRDAENAHKKGYEVIVHLPMETRKNSVRGLSAGAIKTSQTDDEIKSFVINAFKDVPYAVGANNHMGVLASSDRRVVNAVVSVLKKKDKYIVDSKTTPKSVISEVARAHEVPVIEMSVFLDNEKAPETIKRQINLLAYSALKRGYAIGIGHVGPLGGSNTAKMIKEMIPELEKRGIKIVFVSELMRDKYK